MDQNYGGVIWTNHALQRLKERGIKQGDAWVTWSRPDHSRYAQSKGAWIYYRTYASRGGQGQEKIEVVAKKNEEGKWVILTVWSRPVYEKHGAKHHKKKSLIKPTDSLFIKFLKKVFLK